MEGSISLGIFDSTGKLVRVLERETGLDEFSVGTDSVSTTWDGKDDRGELLPPGKYRARGYTVGDLQVEGVGYFFNDWVSDEDAPHLQRVNNLKLIGDDKLALLVTFAGGADGSATCDLTSGTVTASSDEAGTDERFLPERAAAQIKDGRLLLQRAEGWKPVAWPELIAPFAAAAGRDNSVWVLDRASKDSEQRALKHFASDGTFQRQMLFPEDAPQPVAITASTQQDRVVLLEEKEGATQRVRALAHVATTPATDDARQALSDWEVVFEKTIQAHENFTIVNSQPVLPDLAAVPSPDPVTIKLQANPLVRGESEPIALSVGFDKEGSFLQTADGLPLYTVSETPHLRRALLSKAGLKTVEVFQDDGAVVEHFRVTELQQMMAFDCGEIELK